MRTSLFCVLLALFIGCGGPPALNDGEHARDATFNEPQTHDAPAPEVPKERETAVTDDAPPKIELQAEGDGGSELPIDSPAERKPDDPPPTDLPTERPPDNNPVTCPPTSACNARLTSGGTCPGDCVPQERKAHCIGKVAHGVCYDAILPGPPGPFNFGNGMKLVINTSPARATIGQAVTLSAVLSNPTNGPITVKLSARARIPAWTLQSTSFTNPGPVTLAAGTQLQLSATLLPTQATIFDHNEWAALYLMVDNSQATLRLPVGFPPNSGITCGGQSFPKTWCQWTTCKGNGKHYNNAQCCDGVFYPGADCCSDKDCPKGTCFDGLCVATAPNNNLALGPLSGHQRILVIAADQGIPQPTGGPCTKADAALEQKLNLDKVATWLTERVKARTHKALLKIHWHTLIIPDSKVFEPGTDKVDPISTLAKLEAWLKQQNCIKGFDLEFDKVLLIMSRLQISSTGRAVAPGRAVALSYSPHSLLAHELGHLYGARDLYLTAGGELQWRSALMSSAEIPGGATQGLWSDAVFWGEVGLGDTDKNGVIDVFQWPVDPIALLPGSLKVTALTTGNNPELKLHVPLQAKEADGTLLQIRIPTLHITLPDYGIFAATLIGHEATFKGPRFDPAPIIKAGQVKVRLEVTWHYTRTDGTRHVLTLDHTATLTVP